MHRKKHHYTLKLVFSGVLNQERKQVSNERVKFIDLVG